MDQDCDNNLPKTWKGKNSNNLVLSSCFGLLGLGWWALRCQPTLVQPSLNLILVKSWFETKFSPKGALKAKTPHNNNMNIYNALPLSYTLRITSFKLSQSATRKSPFYYLFLVFHSFFLYRWKVALSALVIQRTHLVKNICSPSPTAFL